MGKATAGLFVSLDRKRRSNDRRRWPALLLDGVIITGFEHPAQRAMGGHHD